MKPELSPVGGDDGAGEASRPEGISRRGLTGLDRDPGEVARREAASPMRLFQADTFEMAARRPLVSLG